MAAVSMKQFVLIAIFGLLIMIVSGDEEAANNSYDDKANTSQTPDLQQSLLSRDQRIHYQHPFCKFSMPAKSRYDDILTAIKCIDKLLSVANDNGLSIVNQVYGFKSSQNRGEITQDILYGLFASDLYANKFAHNNKEDNEDLNHVRPAIFGDIRTRQEYGSVRSKRATDTNTGSGSGSGSSSGSGSGSGSGFGRRNESSAESRRLNSEFNDHSDNESERAGFGGALRELTSGLNRISRNNPRARPEIRDLLRNIEPRLKSMCSNIGSSHHSSSGGGHSNSGGGYGSHRGSGYGSGYDGGYGGNNHHQHHSHSSGSDSFLSSAYPSDSHTQGHSNYRPTGANYDYSEQKRQSSSTNRERTTNQ